MCCLIRYKIMLKGCHLIFSEYRRLGSAPQIPHKISGSILLRIILRQKICLVDLFSNIIHKCSSCQLLPIADHSLKASGRPHGNAAVVKQISIMALVQGAVGVEETDVLVEKSAVSEGHNQSVQKLVLFFCQPQRMLGINGGKHRIQHGIFCSLNRNHTSAVIHRLQQNPIIHLVAGMTLNNLSFHLKLNHSNRFMHFSCQPRIYCIIYIFIKNFRRKLAAGVIPVHL